MFFESSLGELTVTVFPRILKKKIHPGKIHFTFYTRKVNTVVLLKRVEPSLFSSDLIVFIFKP